MALNSAQYLLADRLDVAELGRALAPSFAVRADARARAEQSFYDTFDGRLHRAGLSLVHEDGRLLVLDNGHERGGVSWPARPARLRTVDLPPGGVRELLEPIVDVRALMPTARVRTSTRRLRILDDEAKTVIRLEVQESRLVGAQDSRMRPRLHAVAVRGYQKQLARVCRRLEADLGLVRADVSLGDEAVIAAGGTPGGVSSRPDVELYPDESAGRAATRISRRLLEVIEANLPGTLADVDTEFLHDLRVAVRRTRSLQRQLARVFPADGLARFRDEFRWLQAATSATRDLDVYLLGFDGFAAMLAADRRPDLEPLRELLGRRRAHARRRTVRALRSARMNTLLREWPEFLATVDHDAFGTASEAGQPVARVAGARIAKVYRQMVRAGGAIDETSPPDALHELRKRGKELRYLLEFFASLYPARVIKPMVGTLKALQDTLGRFQDHEVQAELIRSLGVEVGSRADGAPALIAMGQLVERLEQRQADARAEFAERFAAFASRGQRALVRETFA